MRMRLRLVMRWRGGVEFSGREVVGRDLVLRKVVGGNPLRLGVGPGWVI